MIAGEPTYSYIKELEEQVAMLRCCGNCKKREGLNWCKEFSPNNRHLRTGDDLRPEEKCHFTPSRWEQLHV